MTSENAKLFPILRWEGEILSKWTLSRLIYRFNVVPKKCEQCSSKYQRKQFENSYATRRHQEQQKPMCAKSKARGLPILDFKLQYIDTGMKKKDTVLAQNQHVNQCRGTERAKQSQAYSAIRSLISHKNPHTSVSKAF